MFPILFIGTTAGSTSDYCPSARWPTPNYHSGESTKFVTSPTSTTIDTDTTKPGNKNNHVKRNDHPTYFLGSRVTWPVCSSVFNFNFNFHVILFSVKNKILCFQQQNNQTITVDGQEALFIPGGSNHGQGAPTIFTPTGQIVRPLQTIQLQSGMSC